MKKVVVDFTCAFFNKKWRFAMKKLLYSFLSIITIASFLPTQASAQGEFEGEKVTIGLASSNAYDYWDVVVENALEQEGIEIELVLFSDYNQPNEALQNGSLRSEEHTSELQSRFDLVCRLLLEKK